MPQAVVFSANFATLREQEAVFRMKGRIRIDTERCKGCSYCQEACPGSVIAIRDNFNKGGFFLAFVEYPEKCTGCAICATVCPEVAIEVYRDSHRKTK